MCLNVMLKWIEV